MMISEIIFNIHACGSGLRVLFFFSFLLGACVQLPMMECRQRAAGSASSVTANLLAAYLCFLPVMHCPLVPETILEAGA